MVKYKCASCKKELDKFIVSATYEVGVELENKEGEIEDTPRYFWNSVEGVNDGNIYCSYCTSKLYIFQDVAEKILKGEDIGDMGWYPDIIKVEEDSEKEGKKLPFKPNYKMAEYRGGVK